MTVSPGSSIGHQIDQRPGLSRCWTQRTWSLASARRRAQSLLEPQLRGGHPASDGHPHGRAAGLHTLDAVIAATTLEEGPTLATKNCKQRAALSDSSQERRT